MIGDRERRPLDDIGAIWLGHGVELADRVKTFAHEIRGLDLTADQIADQLNELLTTDYNPRPPARPELGAPPMPRARPGIQLRTGPHESGLRRAREPGEA